MNHQQRPTWTEIDLSKLEKNYRALRAFVAPNTKILAVVKADGYGHGSVEVSRRLEAAGVDYFGVAIVEEAIRLRQASITKPILVMGGFWQGQERAIIEHRLTPAVYRLDRLRSLSQAARASNITVSYHLKIDTGMGRIGVSYQTAHAFLQTAAALERVQLEGVFAMLSSADESSREFTQLQIERFHEAVRRIEACGIHIPIKHTTNSAGLLYYPEAWFDMVRPGLALYGVVSGPKAKDLAVEPVLALKSRISFLKTVPPYTPLGYGRRFTTGRESTIATLPIGYADGLRRRLSNKGRVIVRDRFAPIVGAISMDMTLIDVTDVPGASIDDEVILIGKSATLSISATEMATEADTIPYEILCGIGKRVPRLYLET
jgi:alanine racemase